MDDVELIEILYLMGCIGFFVYLIYQALIAKREEAVAEFKRAPLFTVGSLLSVLGVLAFLAGIVSRGHLYFEIPTPWGTLKSYWAGALFALLSFPCLLLRPRRRR